MLAFGPISEDQAPLRVIICPTQFCRHEGTEKSIDEIEQALAAAEVFGEEQRRSPSVLPPLGGVTLKDTRVRLTKAIDALLHITDHESIRFVRAAAYGLQNLVLGRVNILVLVDEDPLQSLLPFAGQFGGLAVTPKQPKGILFKVVKIELTHGALCGFEAMRKISSQCQEAADKGGAPLPILEHWIGASVDHDAGQELH